VKPAKLLQAHCFDDFRCIGAECEDNCCVGWNIHVDKSTYDKYQNCTDPHWATPLQTLIKINEKSSNQEDFSRIVLNGATCPFLSEGLCSIQQQLGEDYLSNMCATYPRVINRVDEVLQRSLDLSCPEAARKVLLDSTPIEFYDSEYQEGAIHHREFPALDTSLLGQAPEPYRVYRDTRRLVIALLQHRAFPMWERLFLVGCLVERLDEAASQGWDGAAPLHSGIWNDLPSKSSAPPTAQLETVLEMIVARIGSDPASRRFFECYSEFMHGIKWTSKSSMEEIGARYDEARAQDYASFIQRHDYMLENYLVNYAHLNLFPFGIPAGTQRLRGGSGPLPLARQYMFLIACYAITRTLLIGMSAFHKSALDSSHLVKLVQSCTKTFEHSLTFPQRVIEILTGKSMTTPSSLCTLTRD
jgi:lysine-N-methylase